jgi:hypothetical protein
MPAAMGRRSALARAAAIGVSVSFLWPEALERSDARIRDSLAVIAVSSLAFLTTASVGAFLALRRPANAIGWLLMALGWVWAISGPTDLYRSYSFLQRSAPLTAAREVAWLGP